MKNILSKIISFLGTLFLFLFGKFDYLLKSMLVLMVIDYITGVFKSFFNKKLNSSIGAKGIIKKVVYLCIIVVSVILDEMLKSNGAVRTIVISSFIFNEMLSILENGGEIGIKIPNSLYKSLEKLNKNNENREKDLF